MKLRHLLIIAILYISFQPSGSAQSNYTLINDAIIYSGCNCFQLTADADNQGGGVYQNNTINLNNSFDYTFSVYLGTNTSNGADGMVFVLTNNITGIGAQGGGLGYSGLSGNSVGIEFDTYQNSWDPPYNHIAIEVSGQVEHPVGTIAGPVSALPSAANIDDGNWHTVHITWDVSTHTYTVYFDGNLRTSYTGNIVANYFAGNPIVNWGWSGSTGADNNYQRFCVLRTSNWLAGTDYETCNLTVPFHDISTSSLGSVQSWAWNFGDPASGTHDTSSLENPSHTFSTDGTYTVTLIITDITGCADTFNHTLVVNPAISLADTLHNPLCNGGSNGSIDLGASGGFGAAAGYGGYMYSWSNGITVPDEIGVTAGTYDVTVTDGVCTTTGTYTLNQPPALTAVLSDVDPSCGQNNGSVTIDSIVGGTPPYSNVSWDGTAGYTLTGIGPGTYVANFQDANGCSALLTYKETLVNQPCGYTVSTSSTNVSCFGGSNGSVTLTVTGGTAPENITWDNSAGTQVGTVATVSGLPAGTYTYHYSDAVPTTFTGTVTVTQPGGPLTIGLNTVNTSCSYLDDGSAVASILANGSPPYTYAWSAAGEPDSPTATGLSPGTIYVTVTDHNGCQAIDSGVVHGQPAISASVTTTPDSCFGNSTGTATVHASGGNPGYTYLWSNSAIGDTNFNIPSGPYTVVVTDHNGCTATASGSVSQPPVLTDTITQVSVTCFGGSNGSATNIPGGGNGGYTYVWSTSATSVTATGLSDSTYYVTVTDSKRCMVVDSVTINQPSQLLPAIVALDSVTCFNGTNGGVTVTASGGTPSYTYSLDGSGTFQASGTFSGLSSGAHTVTVKDAHGCDSTISFSIYQPTVISPSILYTRDVSCNSLCNGAIAVTATGGVPPYTYSIDGVIFSSVDSFTSLCANLYTITVKDANGCTKTITDSVTQPSALLLSLVSVTPPSCFGDSNGQIVILATGGTLPYLYDIDFGTPQLTGTFSGLSAGLHIVGAGDAHLCIDTFHILLTQPAQLVADTISTREVSCFGGDNGTITLGVSGGTYPYIYTWTGAPGITDSLGVNLAMGTYVIHISDAHGCTDSVSVSITQPTQILPSVVSTDSVTCHGGNNGGVTVTATGGTPGYTYALDGSAIYQASGTFSGLTAGTHTVTVKDANGCDSILSFNIYQPTLIVPSITYTRDVSCNSACNGSIMASATGGVPPYTYSIDGVTFSSVDSFTSLCANLYTITVKDSNGCTQTITDSVTQPAVLSLSVVSVTSPLCFGGNNGEIVVTASGGTLPYLYDIDFGTPQLTGTFTGLSAGLHIVGVGDAHLCLDTLHILMTQPALLVADTISTQQVSCHGGDNGAITLGVSGGTYPYSYIWTGAPAITDSLAINLAAGTYVAHITDANGCTDSVTAVITQPTPLAPSIVQIDSVSCFNGTNGGITVTTTGGTPGYTYALDGSGTYQVSGTFTGLAAGAHIITVKDANGCDSIFPFNIYQPPLLTASVAYTRDVSCNGNCNGSILISPAGGTAPYSYSIDGVTFSPVDSFTSLCANLYTITVKDANGCTTTITDSVTQPSPLVLSLTSVTSPQCFGGSNGQISVSASGGSPVYLYDIDFGTPQASGTFTGLSAGLHIVGVVDNHLCVDTLHILVTQPAQLVADTLSTQEPACFGNSNGSITLGVSGGTYAYTYSWTGAAGVTDSIATNLSVGTYTAHITDANGCNTSVTVILGQPALLSLSIAQNDSVSCFGGTNGGVTVSGVGGTTPYVYALDGSGTYQSSATFSGLSAGAHTVTIKDAHGCDSTISFTIYQPTALSASIVYVNNVLSCNSTCGGSILASAAGGTPPYTYSIDGTTFSTVDSFTEVCAGTYTVTIKDANGCTAVSPTQATIPAPPPPAVADIEPGDITVLQDSMVQLTTNVTYPPSAINGYSWTPSTGLSCDTCPNPIVNTTTATDSVLYYTVTVTYNNSCTVTASDTIHIMTGTAIGNAFTPNGDGKNDLFTIMASGVSTFSINIYDRWGQLVYQSNDINTGWDGTYKGSPEPIGEYIYYIAITFTNGQTSNKTGTVMLLR